MIKLLGELFLKEEEKLNYDNLSIIFSIFKNILVISNQNILEMLVHDDFYQILLGALECKINNQLDENESIQLKKFIRHRKFICEESKFKNIFNIDDSSIIDKIKMNFRLTYLKDVAIARFIEETTIKNLNIIIHYNNSDILQYFTTHKTIFKSLFEMINSEKLDVKYEGMAFMMELNNISKDLMQTKIYFYETLCEMNLLEVIENLFIFLSLNRKIKYGKHKHLPENNFNSEDISEEDKRKREILEINSIEILICCLTVVPSM